jgi:hypothetical protein
LPPPTDGTLDAVVLITGTVKGKFGTGFVFRVEDEQAWVLSCAHVVRDVGGPGNVRVDDPRIEDTAAEVLACGERRQADLAVLRVRMRRDKHIPPLKLGLAGQKDQPCTVSGYADLIDEWRRAEPLGGTLGPSDVLLAPSGPRIKVWKLRLERDTPLEEGYSGSPVTCTTTNTVFAVASISEYQGERGYAVSLTHLKEIWPEAPQDLFVGGAGFEFDLDGGQRAFLEDLFRNPPVSMDQLRRLCLVSTPTEVRNRPTAESNGLDLLYWLQDRDPLDNDGAPLLEVLNALLPSVEAESKREMLEGVIKTVAAYFAVPIPSPGGPGRLAIREQKLPVLLVEIWPIGSVGGRWHVQAHLCGSDAEVHKVYVREGDTAMRIDDREELAEFVDDVRGLIAQTGVDEDWVTVEFAVPLDLLSRNMDRWGDTGNDPLGVYQPVVVRSRERLREPRYQRGWSTNWNALQGHVHEKMSRRLWWFEEKAKRQVPGKVKEGFCVAFGDPPDITGDSRKNSLMYMISRGASVVLWPRHGDNVVNLQDELKDHLKGSTLGELPRTLRDLRHSLWEANQESSPCYHISLLWDDPTRRLPEQPKHDDEFYQAPI